MNRRICLMIEDDVDKILRIHQAKLIRKNQCSVSYSEVINSVLRENYVWKKWIIILNVQIAPKTDWTYQYMKALMALFAHYVIQYVKNNLKYFWLGRALKKKAFAKILHLSRNFQSIVYLFTLSMASMSELIDFSIFCCFTWSVSCSNSLDKLSNFFSRVIIMANKVLLRT